MPRILQRDLNKCVSISSASGKITFTNPASFDGSTITVGVWLNPRTLFNTTGDRIIDLSTGGFQLLFDTATRTLQAAISHTVTNATARYPVGSVPIGKWSRIVFTWNNAENTPTLYLNGNFITPLSTLSKSGTYTGCSGAVGTLGNRNSDNARRYDGLIDEVCVWNRILTATEIATDYSTSSPTSGLILYYKMDEAAATGTCTDSSGNSITGTCSSVTQGVTSFSVPIRNTVKRTIVRKNKVKGSATGGQASIATAAFSATTGNCIVVVIREGTGAGGTVTGVTDTAGNSYTLLKSDKVLDPNMYLYYAKNIIGNASNIVTAQFSANVNFAWVYAVEYAGVDTTNPIDVFGSNPVAVAATDLVSTAITTAQIGDVVIMGVSQSNFGTYTAGTDFTLLDGAIGAGPYGGMEEYITTTQLSSYIGHITSSSNLTYTTIWVALKPGNNRIVAGLRTSI